MVKTLVLKEKKEKRNWYIVADTYTASQAIIRSLFLGGGISKMLECRSKT